MTVTGPSMTIPGLPSFNAGNPNFKVTGFDGWWNTAKPRAELVASGAGDGAVAVGPWNFAEAYYTLSGLIHSTDRPTLMGYRRALLAAFPANAESTVTVLGNSEDVDLIIDVRRYDIPDIRVEANNLLFTVPLVAVDPFKYAASLLSGSMTAFNGTVWFQLFTIDTVPNPDQFFHALTQDTVAAALQAAVLNSPGDVTSRRLTIDVSGPLLAGDWFLLHENTGRHLFTDLALASGSVIEFDCYRQRAYLDGQPIDQHVFGDYLTLEPGVNTYRLITGSVSTGTASVQGRPAYQ